MPRGGGKHIMDIYPVHNAAELRAALTSLAQVLGVPVVRDNGPPYEIFGQISQKASFTRMDGNYSATMVTRYRNELQFSINIWDTEPALTVTIRTRRGKSTSIRKVFRRGGHVEEYKDLPRWFLGLNDPELQNVKLWAGGVTCARTACPSQPTTVLRSAHAS